MDTVFARYIHPWILPSYEEVALDNGRRVAVVTVTQGTSKPYVLRHQGREEICVVWAAPAAVRLREQQARLFATGGLIHTETLPVSGSNLEDREPRPGCPTIYAMSSVTTRYL
ncbi:MAG: hypothetical protein U5L11_10745 [Arhodomonas sp.]|nr:hypothetical protein [Arhodomonas sp.]